MSDSELDNTAKRERALRFQFGRVPFNLGLGLVLEEHSEHGARVRMPFGEEISTGFGNPHGGAIASLLDATGAAAAWAGHDFERGERGATIGLTVNYTGAARSEDIIATAAVIRRAKELVFLDVRIETEDGKSIAHGVMTYRIA
jgi:uncharacterized protein (TIGR00369 family)